MAILTNTFYSVIVGDDGSPSKHPFAKITLKDGEFFYSNEGLRDFLEKRLGRAFDDSLSEEEKTEAMELLPQLYSGTYLFAELTKTR